jgi:hypothetical protein
MHARTRKTAFLIGAAAAGVALAPAAHADPDYRDPSVYTDMLTQHYGKHICQAIDVNPTVVGLADVHDAMSRWWPFLSEAELTTTMDKSIAKYCPGNASARDRPGAPVAPGPTNQW